MYIKDGNIHFYNEEGSLSNIGGIVFELGKPLLNFVCYEQARFDDGFSMMADVFDHEFAYMSATQPDFKAGLNEAMGAFQQQEIYVYFYKQLLLDFIFTFIDSPKKAIEQLAGKIPGAEEKLDWTKNFEWPIPPPGKVYADKEKRLFRAVKDVVALLAEDLRAAQEATIYEVDLLILLRENVGLQTGSSMEYLYILDQLNVEHTGHSHFLEKPFRAFYGATIPPEIALLYEIDSIKDLLRFEFIKMIEHDIFIKKCKNCGHFFIPKRRADAEYCERPYGDTQRKCSEIGATLRYERKVAGNPILEAHKKAYRRFNSRTRAKKMTQSEFLAWSEEARQKRDACLAGELPFEEFSAWLEQGRIRKSRQT
ncbi:MAG: DUF6076 domain-containing protein [Clostridiales bacterium]|nr:DUF6076 domain-containing protein [Clostridiales bacterium]